MNRLFDSRIMQFLYGLFIRLLIFFQELLKVILLVVVERFVPRKKRPGLWRSVSWFQTRMFYKISGVRIEAPASVLQKFNDSTPAVLVANHPSFMDGFTLFSLLGPDLITLVQPFSRFTFPFNITFSKFDYVDVIRDEYDARHDKKANDKKTAIKKLVQHLLKKKNSVLIFPEGHLERLNVLHHIHTGAARIAIKSGRPILPIAIVNMDKILLGRVRARPGVITVRTANPLYNGQTKMKGASAVPPKKAVRELSEKIEQELRHLLPSRNVPMDADERHPEKIGVFLDIDHTVYKGTLQLDFAKYLVRHRHIERKYLRKGMRYMFLEKTGFMFHQEFVQKALYFLAGWSKENIERLAKDFFDEHVIERLEHNILPIIYDHRKNGHTIFFVTEVMEPLARQFKIYFKAKDFAATALETEKGLLTGSFKRLCWREEKAEQVHRLAEKYNIDLNKSYAYADSDEDIPMLKLVKHKIVIHPKPEIEYMANTYNWHILR